MNITYVDGANTNISNVVNTIKESNDIIISLGWNCTPRALIKNLFNLSKGNGYNSCPFDLCVTPFKGLVDCLSENFSRFFNLRIVDGVIMNDYDMWFNHESAAVLIAHNQEPDIYTKDDFKLFKERYNQRISNFRQYINNGRIIFIISNPVDNIELLLSALRTMIKSFHIVVIRDSLYEDSLFHRHFGL